MRNLTLEGRIAIFKIFIIVFQSLINIIPNHIISKLIKYSKKKKSKGKNQIQKLDMKHYVKNTKIEVLRMSTFQDIQKL